MWSGYFKFERSDRNVKPTIKDWLTDNTRVLYIDVRIYIYVYV